MIKDNLLSIFRLGWFKVTLAIILMFGIGSYISDSLGIAFGWLGAFIWIVITIFAAAFGIIYFAQFITPTAGDDGWWAGLILILNSFSSDTANTRTTKTSSDRRRRQRTRAAPTTKPNQLPPSFKSLRAGILRTHQIVATVYKRKYGGAKGPGFVQLRKKELIRQLVDLRIQYRRMGKVRVTTRDGIQITTTVSVRFRIQPGESHDEHVLFPYDKNAIFQVSYADAVDDHGDPLPWQDKLVPQAITYATQEVGKYTLNELTSLDESGVSSIGEINRVIQQEMERKFTPRGIEIISASMGAPILPESIQEQRLNSWQAEWQEKTKQKYADSEIETLQQRKEVRARAQIKIIDTIARNLDLMQRDDDSEMVGLITLRMIEALEEAVSQESVKSLVPQQIMANLIATTSEQMRTNSSAQTDSGPDSDPDNGPDKEQPTPPPQPPQNNMAPPDEDEE